MNQQDQKQDQTPGQPDSKPMSDQELVQDIKALLLKLDSNPVKRDLLLQALRETQPSTSATARTKPPKT